jgi:hypothetical protein
MLLHEARRARCARALLQRKPHADAHDFLVSSAQCHVQETKWIKERLRRMPERFEDGLLRDLGGACAIRVPAHTVNDEKQSRVLGYRGDDTILVFFARAEQ